MYIYSYVILYGTVLYGIVVEFSFSCFFNTSTVLYSRAEYSTRTRMSSTI